MRFYGIALLTGAALLGACGGEKAPATDTAAANAAATSTPAATATTPAATTTTTATPATGTTTAAAAPATGKTHEVKMIGDPANGGYRFEPANITIKAGDAIKWIMVSGGPHNVAFQNVTNAAALSQIDANMTGQKMGQASSPMAMQPNEAITVSFANVPAGTYEYVCMPHAAMNMKGSVTVQ